MVLMGVLASRMDLPEDVWQAALTKQVPAKFLELNRRAFALGAGAEGGLTMAVRQLSVFLENRNRHALRGDAGAFRQWHRRARHHAGPTQWNLASSASSSATR